MNNQEMVRAYQEMAASCRERGMLESAGSWQALAEAAQHDLERESQACWQDEQGMRAFEDAMWGKWKRENAIEPVLPEQVAEKDCPLCPEWAEEKFKIGYDDFGGICEIDGVACCDTCYRVYHLTHPYEESL